MATYINNNVKFHAFSKSPVSPDTTLGGAVNPSGHTITTSQVRAQDIPAFLNTFQGTKDTAIKWLGTNYATPAHNDIAYYGGEFKAGFDTPKCLKYNGKTSTWEDFDLKYTDRQNKVLRTTLKNADDKDVLAIHQDCSTVFVDGGNNAATNSNRWSLFVKKADGSILDHFVASTDKIVAGMPSLGYNALVMLNNAAIDEGELDANYVGNTFAGIIHLNKQYANGDDAKFKVTCFEYIGDKLDTTLGNIREEIQDIVGVTMEGVVASVGTNDAATSAGIGVDSSVKTSPKITFTAGSVATGETKLVSGGAVKTYVDTTALAEGGSIAQKITSAIAALGDVAVKSDIKISDIKVKVGSGTATSLTPDSNKSVTIEIPDAPEAVVTAEGTVTTDGFTKTTAVTSLANAAINAAISGTDGAIAGAIDQGISDATSTSAIVDNDTSKKLVTAEQVATYVASEVGAIDTGVASVTLGTVPTGVSLGTDTKNPVLTIEPLQTANISGAEGSTKLVTAGVAHSIATHYASVAEGAAVNTINGKSLTSLASSTQGSYVTVTTSGTVGSGLTVNVNDSALASTVSAAASAIQTVKVNNTALTKNGTEVNITALTGINDSNNASNGITLTDSIAGSTDKKLGIIVTPATYTKKSGTTPGSWENLSAGYLATAQSVSDAISDAISGIDFPDIRTDANSGGYGISFSSHTETGAISNHYMHIATAAYTPSTETGKLGEWTAANKGYLVTGATVAAAIGDVNAKVDALHQTPQFKVVVVDDVTDLTKWQDSVTGGIQENYIYLVENIDAADGSYIEYIAYKNGETLVTERIGTTKTDLSGYAKSVTINGQTYTASAANAGALDLGTVVNGIGADNDTSKGAQPDNAGSIQSYITSYGSLYLGVASATNTVKGLSKLFTGNYWELSSDVTDTAVSTLTASEMFEDINGRINRKADADNVVNSINGVKGQIKFGVTNGLWRTLSDKDYSEGEAYSTGYPENDWDTSCNLWGLSVTGRQYDGELKIADTFIGLPVGSSDELYSYLSLAALPSDAVTVENNFVMNASGKVITTIRPERMVSGFSAKSATGLKSFVGDLSNLTTATFSNDNHDRMTFYSLSALEAFIGDLSSLTDGYCMFYDCRNLTTFISDLSSLTNASHMFSGCKLDAESLDCIADTINDVRSLTTSEEVTKTIDIGYNCSAAEANAAKVAIEAKGWTCGMSYNA